MLERHARTAMYRSISTSGYLAVLLTVVITTAILSEEVSDPLGWLEVKPNAIQDPSRPMTIRVGDLSQGDTVKFVVLENCDGSLVRCRSLLEWTSPPANADGTIVDHLDFVALAAEGKELPKQKTLWLRAVLSNSQQAHQVIFGLVENPCTLWKSIIDTFLHRPCTPNLEEALLFHRGDNVLNKFIFEVRFLEPDRHNPRATTVPGTRPATGVGWLDNKTLLVTRGYLVGPVGLQEDPGLYKVTLRGDKTILWAAEEGWIPAAPIALTKDRFAFVQNKDKETLIGPLSYLYVIEGKKLVSKIPLPVKIHQMIAADSDRISILAITLGLQDSRPHFLKINLDTGYIENLGYHDSLYHAALGSPSHPVSVISYEDRSSSRGWEIVLVDDNGQLVFWLKTRKQHDLAPTWRQDGNLLAYLAQISG